jgi:hypothetical protein
MDGVQEVLVKKRGITWEDAEMRVEKLIKDLNQYLEIILSNT